jgi:hypothetical protein
MSSDSPYDIGDEVILTGLFTDPVTGDPKDPTAVTASIRTPDGTTSPLTAPTKISTGTYTTTFVPTQEGEHWWRFAGTGTATAAEEGVFAVRKRRVP